MAELQTRYANVPEALQILEQHRQEIDLYRHYSDYYGYVFYSLEIEA